MKVMTVHVLISNLQSRLVGVVFRRDFTYWRKLRLGL